MRTIIFVAVFSVAYISSFGEVLQGGTSNEQLVYQQKISIVFQMILSKCPNANVSLSFNTDLSLTYQRLIRQLVECETQALKVTPSPGNATTTVNPVGQDCQEYFERGEKQSGIYYISPPGSTLPAFTVWCTMGENHGWTVIQRNLNGPENFDRPWEDYKKGFGDITGEHYLGNEKIHLLTRANQRLNIYLVATGKASASGNWRKFMVANETDKYRLTIQGHGYSGSLLDSFSPNHNGMMFSTADNDNDVGKGNRSCAVDHKGGWWYAGCGDVGLNSESYSGIFWRHFLADSSVMRITRD